MKQTPYSGLPKSAFWKTAVVESSPFSPSDIFTPKWTFNKETRIATAGSCFAQHITKALRSLEFNVLDVETPTTGLREDSWPQFGYGIYSARYGNIYTVQQLLTITREAFTNFKPVERCWELENRFVDAMRPSIEPLGLSSFQEVIKHREFHLEKVRELFLKMDLFIFTLGLTEAWVHAEDDTTYPVCPGVISGKFDQSKHKFRNFGFEETLEALNEFRRLLHESRNGRRFRMLLTVSPVPLTATVSGRHVLQASTYSKAVLRAVAGKLADTEEDVDYFPSYEIITNPALRSMFYRQNLRSVSPEGVNSAMQTFLRVIGIVDLPSNSGKSSEITELSHAGAQDPQCEEYLLEAFSE